jgi:integrase
VLALTGCRPGEALGLKVSDLDFRNRVIRIERTLGHCSAQDSASRLRMPSAKSLSSDTTRPDGNTNLEALEVISLVR